MHPNTDNVCQGASLTSVLTAFLCFFQQCRKCYMYRISYSNFPNNSTQVWGKTHHAERTCVAYLSAQDWDVEKWLQEVRLRVVEQGDRCTVFLDDITTGSSTARSHPHMISLLEHVDVRKVYRNKIFRVVRTSNR